MNIPNLQRDPEGLNFLIQTALASLGYYPKEQIDNIDGPKTRDALKRFQRDISATGGFRGLASSFADPADVEAFRRCKRQGRSDEQCFAVGDNGRGAWNADTTNPNEPMVAVPRDLIAHRWGTEDAGRNKIVRLIINGKTFKARLADKMPAQKNVKNKAVIDLNPGAQNVAGLKPPFLLPVAWWWEDDLT